MAFFVNQESTERPLSGQSREASVRKRGFLDPEVGCAPLIVAYFGVSNGRRPSGNVGAPSEAWRFLPGASPGRERDQDDCSQGLTTHPYRVLRLWRTALPMVERL